MLADFGVWLGKALHRLQQQGSVGIEIGRAGPANSLLHLRPGWKIPGPLGGHVQCEPLHYGSLKQPGRQGDFFLAEGMYTKRPIGVQLFLRFRLKSSR